MTTVGRKKKSPNEKTTTLTISILREPKEKFLEFIGNRNQSEFVRAAIEEKMKKEMRRKSKF